MGDSYTYFLKASRFNCWPNCSISRPVCHFSLTVINKKRQVLSGRNQSHQITKDRNSNFCNHPSLDESNTNSPVPRSRSSGTASRQVVNINAEIPTKDSYPPKSLKLHPTGIKVISPAHPSPQSQHPIERNETFSSPANPVYLDLRSTSLSSHLLPQIQ